MVNTNMTNINEEIKKLIATPKAVVGTQRTLKGLRSGKINKVFLAKNVKNTIKSDIETYAKINNTEVITLELANNELGTICKKPYSISVLGEMK